MAGKIAVYEHIEEEFNADTGEIFRAKNYSSKRIPTEKEADYVKVYKYTNTVFAFKGIPLTLVPVIIEISKYMSFAEQGQTVVLNKIVKEQICNVLDIKIDRMNKCIQQLVKNDVLRKTTCRGMYAVNPFICSCGDAMKIKELQAKFDYDADLMSVSRVEENFITGKFVRKAIQEVRHKQIEQKNQIAGQLSFDDYKDKEE